MTTKGRTLLSQVSLFEDGTVAYRGAVQKDVPGVLRWLANTWAPVVEIVDPGALLRDIPELPEAENEATS